MLRSWRSQLCALCLLSVAASLCCALLPPLLYYEDAVQYLSIAEHLARGQGFHSATFRFPDLMQPPLYPLLLAAPLRLLGAPLAVAVGVYCAVQVAILLCLVALHQRCFGPAGRGVTGLCAALCPNQVFGAALTLEPLLLLWLALALLLLVGGLRRGALLPVAGAGAALGLGLLTRPEALLTAAGLGLLALLWPGTRALRAARAGLLLGSFLVVVLPYGLWVRGHLGVFDVLPKLRYNVPYAAITERIRWAPGEERLSGREQRVFFTLMPDQATFVMNHAFAHPGYDAAGHFPLQDARRPSAAAQLRGLLTGLRQVLRDATTRSFALHPLALLLMGLALYPLRRREPEGWLLPTTLLGLCLLHLLPPVASGVDYTSRYLACTLLFSLPLVGRGAARLAGRTPHRAAGAVLLLSLGLAYGAGSGYALWRLSGGPPGWRRTEALQRGCARHVPAGARVLAEHGRCAYLQGAFAYQLPYLQGAAELRGYLQHHSIDHVVLDGRTLRRNPSALCRELADPASWPALLPGFELLEQVLLEGEPAWILRRRG